MSEFIEVEVFEGPNCSWEMTRMFQSQHGAKPLTQIFTDRPDGTEGLCDVVGWSEEGQVPAQAAYVDDSGDGQALLIFGGDQGIRLKAAESEDPFDVENTSQWGEPCLLLDIETQFN
ncbi:MAG: hypothetical protein C1O27_001195 [Chloroflexi bacterium]|jgi:hypothetical protein|nr:MAG: hypothetical protein C1O27_001195 [Chloroflexota bacterium]